MKASGNGSVAQCAANLIATFQGEVPYQMLKGMDTAFLDKNIIEAGPQVKNHATWLLNTYEERATVNDINIISDDSGTVQIVPDISY